MLKVLYGDITTIEADIIVNAANGIGFMGGIIGRFIKLPGVAESIHYKTKGGVEQEAKKKSKKNKWIPSVLCGHRAGEIYVTSAGCLNASFIIHAVTMKYPGMRTSINVIRKLLPLIIQEATKMNAKSIAIPLLGTGTGGIKENEVIELYHKVLAPIDSLEIKVVIYAKER